jgi:hypothetical protein
VRGQARAVLGAHGAGQPAVLDVVARLVVGVPAEDERARDVLHARQVGHAEDVVAIEDLAAVGVAHDDLAGQDRPDQRPHVRAAHGQEAAYPLLPCALETVALTQDAPLPIMKTMAGSYQHWS